MRLLFLHGAGGYAEDRALAASLGSALGWSVGQPRLPDEDMSYVAWSAIVRAALTRDGPPDAVVGHSFGASVLLRVLAEMPSPPSRAMMLAMPDWGPHGWDVADYLLDGPEPTTALSLHHCRDDQVVPFTHLARHEARLPSARCRVHDTGGHQFDGLAESLAADLLAAGG